MKKTTVKATVETGTGVKIMIESDRQTVQEIVSDIYRKEQSRIYSRDRLKMFHSRDLIAHGKTRKSDSSRKPKTLTTLLTGLIKDDFFNSPKTIKEIQKALEAKGYPFPVTSLSPTLLRLLRKEILARKRGEVGWEYMAIKGDKNGKR